MKMLMRKVHDSLQICHINFVKYLFLCKVHMMSNANLQSSSLVSKKIIFVLFCNVNTFDPGEGRICRSKCRTM